jgi:hypothetical protein
LVLMKSMTLFMVLGVLLGARVLLGAWVRLRARVLYHLVRKGRKNGRHSCVPFAGTMVSKPQQSTRPV